MARTAQNRGDSAQALEKSQQAFELNPNHARAGSLAIETAKILSRHDVVQKIAPKLEHAQRVERTREKIQKQMDWAFRDLDKSNVESALTRFAWIERLRLTGAPLEPSTHELIEEARYYSGITHLSFADSNRAIEILSSAREPYRQRALLVLGNFYYQQNYLSQALQTYRRAAVIPKEVTPDSRDVSNASNTLIERLENGAPELHLSSSIQSDSNVLGVSKGTVLTGAVPHDAFAATLSAGASRRSPINADGKASTVLSMDLAQTKVFAGDIRQLADTQTATMGIGATVSRFPIGRGSLKYQFQYLRAKYTQATGVYKYHTSTNSHILTTDLSRQLGDRWDGYFSYHVLRIVDLLPDSVGTYDRTGWGHGGSMTGALRTKTPLLAPSMTLNADWNIVKGTLRYYQTRGFTLSNTLRLGNDLDVSGSIGMDWTNYSNDSRLREDRVLRGSLYGSYSLSSVFSLFNQIYLSNTVSNVADYVQSRVLVTLGVNVSLR